MRKLSVLAMLLISGCGNSQPGKPGSETPDLSDERTYTEWTPERGALSSLASQGDLTRLALLEELYHRTRSSNGRPANAKVIADVLDSKLSLECGELCRISEKE